MPLILASTSRSRKALLRAAGVRFRAVAPGVAERVPLGLAPKAIASRLARLKADAVAARFPKALVLGSDQTVDLGRALLRKPASRAEARRQLQAMAGRAHRLHTAIALRRLDPPFARDAVETVTLWMRRLTPEEIEAYLDTGEWEGCAGGYRVESRGAQLLARVQGDYHAVVGLPILRTLELLRAAGLPLLGSRP